MKKRLLKNKTARNQDNPQTNVPEFQIEIETWKQSLNCRMEENVLLKTDFQTFLKITMTKIRLKK